MGALQLWGLDLIRAIQQVHGPALDNIFRIITFLGTEEFYLVLLPFLMWCIDFPAGARLTILLLFSSYLNTDIKDLLQQPRPFQLDPNVKLSEAEGYSLPSGHAQSAVVVWGGIGVWVRRPIVWAIMIALAVLVGFSRIYLGVHFPTDVLAGWAIGAGLLGIFLVTQERIQRTLERVRLATALALALAVPVILILIHPTKDTIAAMATLSGIAAGLVLAAPYMSLSVRGLWWQRLLRYVIGILIVFGLFFGLKAVFPAEGEAFYTVLRFFRYWMVGLWVSMGGPWAFRLLRLA